MDLEKQARTVEIEAVFDNPQKFLLPGYSADITVIIDTVENTLSVPTQAVIRDEFVYLINEDNTLVKQNIEVGLTNRQHLDEISGLTLDDGIVLSSDRKGVEEGVKVLIEEDETDKDTVSVQGIVEVEAS